MAEKKRVGLYIGLNSIGVIALEGKNLLSLSKIEQSASEDAGAEVTNEDIRWEAFINKALREIGVDVGKVYISIADKDFIFRSLELPMMKRREIESSLEYEIEKYIPFKMEELEWDFEFVRLPQEHKINLSFVGIRENNLRRVRDVFSRLNIEIASIEPSCMSLARAIKSLKQYAKMRDYAVLDLTGSESYLTFFQHDLPVFNRYLVTPVKAAGIELNRFNESVDLSFQYFKREFKSYKLEKCIIVADVVEEPMVALLKESLQTEVDAITAHDLTGRNNATVEAAKALGTAQRGLYPSSFDPVFKKVVSAVAGVTPAAVRIPALRIWVHGTLLVVGLLGSLFLSIFMGNEVSVRKIEFSKEEKSIGIPQPLQPYASWAERSEKTDQREKEIVVLQGFITSFKGYSVFFHQVSLRGVLPEGVWFHRLILRPMGQETQEVSINGYVYRDDDYEERLGLDELVLNLKQNKLLQEYFTSVDLDYSRRLEQRGYPLTEFSILLK